MTLRIGALCSASASAIQASYPLFRRRGIELLVVTHQPCGIEEFCRAEKIEQVRIEGAKRDELSARALDWLQARNAAFSVLFLDRILSEAFVESIYTVNFHPALLPAYPGLNALERSLADRVRYLGVTAHRATPVVDVGKIICQSSHALGARDYDISRALDISFVQRTALLCNIIDSQLDGDGGIPTEGWREPTEPAAVPGDSFVSPCWLSEGSRQLVDRLARERDMTIVL